MALAATIHYPETQAQTGIIYPMSTRDPKGRFIPGKSGNPQGRPRGTAARLLAQLDEAAIAKLLNTVMQNALAGDMSAAKLLLDRLAPPEKPLPVLPVLPDLAANDSTTRAGAILDALAAGDITATEARDLWRVSDSLAKAKIADPFDLPLHELLAPRHRPAQPR